LHPQAQCGRRGLCPLCFLVSPEADRNGQVAGNRTRFPGVTSRCPASWAAHLSGRKWSAARESHPHEHRCSRRFELRVSPIAPAAEVESEGVRTTHAWRGLRNAVAEG